MFDQDWHHPTPPVTNKLQDKLLKLLVRPVGGMIPEELRRRESKKSPRSRLGTAEDS